MTLDYNYITIIKKHELHQYSKILIRLKLKKLKNMEVQNYITLFM